MRKKNKSKLCNFGSLDYMILASSLAIALGEELDSTEVNILASFFAVLADELALIAAIDACESNDPDEDVFVPPVPSVAITTSNRSNKKKVKKIVKKKIKKQKKT